MVKQKVFKEIKSALSYLPLFGVACLVFLSFSMIKRGKKQIVSPYKEGIKIDGKLVEWDYKNAVILDGKKSKSENCVAISSCWDMGMLYLSFEVKDRDLRAYQDSTDHPRLFLDDMVEFLIDTDNGKDSCWGVDDIVYHINILGAKKDDRGTVDCETNPRWNGRAIYKIILHGTLNDTTDVDQGYSVEVGLSWAEIGKTPSAGLTMGINFANGDNDGKGRQLFDWAGAWPMRSPYAFGNLILKEEK